MNKYKTSTGESIEKNKIDKKIRDAKKAFLDNFYDEHGYYFCERTGRSDLKPLDVSHIISVRFAQATGRTELAWDLKNFELLSRAEHLKIEGWTNVKRQTYFQAKKNGMDFETFKMFNYE